MVFPTLYTSLVTPWWQPDYCTLLDDCENCQKIMYQTTPFQILPYDSLMTDWQLPDNYPEKLPNSYILTTWQLHKITAKTAVTLGNQPHYILDHQRYWGSSHARTGGSENCYFSVSCNSAGTYGCDCLKYVQKRNTMESTGLWGCPQLPAA